MKPEKCHFLRHEIAYSGHVITRDGVKPNPEKVEAVKGFPPPKTKENIKQFSGLIGYYREFIPDFAKLAKPSTVVLKDEVPFSWGTAQQEAFEVLREKICSLPILQYPDFSRPFVLKTDASNYAQIRDERTNKIRSLIQISDK